MSPYGSPTQVMHMRHHAYSVLLVVLCRHAAVGFNALGSLTTLTGLHVICHGYFPRRPPAASLAALSRLTQLRELGCEAGKPGHHHVEFDHFTWAQVQDAQAACWGALLPCMPHLTRLQLHEAAAGDTLLCTIGTSAPQLQRLVLFRHSWVQGTSSEGADAIAHVGHIELLCGKNFDCWKHEGLMQLPGVKRVHFLYLHEGSWESKGGSVWTQETCRCYTGVCHGYKD